MDRTPGFEPDNARSSRAATTNAPSSNGKDATVLTWEQRFNSARGIHLNVCVWVAYRETPNGHLVLIWEPGMKWPA